MVHFVIILALIILGIFATPRLDAQTSSRTPRAQQPIKKSTRQPLSESNDSRAKLIIEAGKHYQKTLDLPPPSEHLQDKMQSGIPGVQQ